MLHDGREMIFQIDIWKMTSTFDELEKYANEWQVDRWFIIEVEEGGNF